MVTGDRDLFQVARDDRPHRLVYIGRGMSKAEVLGPPRSPPSTAFRRPRRRAYADFAALRGDPSDGLPGVPGVGAKTAATLVDRFGSWAELRAAIDDRADTRLSPPVRTKLAAAGPYLAVVEPVVRVALDAPVRSGRPDPVPAAPVDPRGWPSWRSGGRWAARWSGWSRRWPRRDVSQGGTLTARRVHGRTHRAVRGNRGRAGDVRVRNGAREAAGSRDGQKWVPHHGAGVVVNSASARAGAVGSCTVHQPVAASVDGLRSPR